MAAIYSNFLSGTITDNPLSSVATTVNSANFANVPAVASPNTMWLVLDPTGSAGAPEIVQITAHTASATSLTVVRAQQTTTARSHASGTTWVVAVTKADMDEMTFRKLTATGDVLYASAANTTTALNIGTTGKMLTVVGGVPAWYGGPNYGAPTAFTHVVKQGVTNSQISQFGSYVRLGRMVIGYAQVLTTAGTPGTASNAVEITLPLAVAATTGNQILGVGSIVVNGGSIHYAQLVYDNGSSTVRFASIPSTPAAQTFLGATGSAFTTALAGGGLVSIQYMYETTTD